MLDRKTAPPFAKTTSFQLPEPISVKLGNGVELHQLKGVQQEIIKLEVVFNAGKWYEPMPGISHFTSQMLEKGTITKSSSQLAEFFDRYGAHIEISNNFDFVSVGLYSLTKHLRILLPVFFEIITQPAFSEPELDQMKDIFIQGLRINNEKTSYQASRLIRKRIFGPAHPYGNTEEEQDLKNIKVTDLHSFFDSTLKPTYIFLLGQTSESDLNEIKNLFGAIELKNTNEPSFSDTLEETSHEVVDKKNSVQSSIRLGKKTILRTHPDYAKLLILNYHLGGYFGARLMKNLREEKGLTYGISSSIHSFKHASIILIGTDINKENRELAIDEIKKEIAHLRTLEIDTNELELAKRHFIGGLQSETASPFSLLGKIKNIILHQLPSDYYQKTIQEVDTVSAETLNNLAQVYFDENTFNEVTVG